MDGLHWHRNVDGSMYGWIACLLNVEFPYAQIYVQRHLTDVMTISMRSHNIENHVMISAIRFTVLTP